MKRIIQLATLLLAFTTFAMADETITVTATNDDISGGLDLKTVAALFGQAKNVEEFETMLNNPDSAYTNLDLNGDGQVDYLRVVETQLDKKHLVVIQAVLAKDIFQDVASIYVEKDETTQQVTTQVIGDEYIYGVNYVIEPVYIYTPYIYDWFWGPYWVCWHSPYYWGYYPHWWHAWGCCGYYAYWDRCHYWHHCHPYCSYRYADRPCSYYTTMRGVVSERQYAATQGRRTFAERTGGLSNARQLERRATATRTDLATHRAATSTRNSSAARSVGTRTFGSANVNGRTTASSARSASTTRNTSTTARTSSSVRTASRAHTSGTSHVATAPRTATTRSATATSNRSTRTTMSSGATRSSSSARTSTPTRTSTTTRSSVPARTSSTARTSSSTRTSSPSRSSGSYGGGSYGGGSRSGGTSSSSGGGSRSGGGGGRSGGGSRR